MKPVFTQEQLDYLNECADIAYSNRWKIGKDYFRALEAFLPYFKWSLSQEKDFGTLLSESDKEYVPYPDCYKYEKYSPF